MDRRDKSRDLKIGTPKKDPDGKQAIGVDAEVTNHIIALKEEKQLCIVHHESQK